MNFEDGGALRVNGDQNGRVYGKNLIAEIKYQFLRWHQEGGRQRLTRALAELTEISDGIGVVFQSLQNRRNTQQRAFPFQA